MVQPPLMQTLFNIEEVANGVLHPITNNTITKYHKLIDEPLLHEVWMKAMCVELGQQNQGYKDTKGTETVKFMTWKEINQIPADETVTYTIIVVDYRAQKNYPNRVRISAGATLSSTHMNSQPEQRTSQHPV